MVSKSTKAKKRAQRARLEVISNIVWNNLPDIIEVRGDERPSLEVEAYASWVAQPKSKKERQARSWHATSVLVGMLEYQHPRGILLEAGVI